MSPRGAQPPVVRFGSIAFAPIVALHLEANDQTYPILIRLQLQEAAEASSGSSERLFELNLGGEAADRMSARAEPHSHPRQVPSQRNRLRAAAYGPE
jgi:hypothetical protein